MKRVNRATIEKAIREITRGSLSPLLMDSGFRECADGLEMIRDRTRGKPFDFAAFTDRFLRDFQLWIDGQNGEVFFHDPFAEKSNPFLKRTCIIREPAPAIKKEMAKVIDNLSEWTARPEFNVPSIPAKQKEFTIDEAARLARVSRRQIEYDLDNDKLQVDKKGRRILISRKNLLSYTREKKKNQK